LARHHQRDLALVPFEPGSSVSGPVVSSTRVYAVIERDEAVLLVRASELTAAPGAWWLPGGGIDPLESPLEALEREVLEETGLALCGAELLDVTSDVRERRSGHIFHTIRIIYRGNVAEGEPRAEADGTTDLARWVPIQSLNDLRLAPYARSAIDAARR
jgi:ADP-ribose pyrophosphatase YjhB (NUDIX family)